jgi:hypothetical protein
MADRSDIREDAEGALAGWQDIASAPQGGGAERVDDPLWVEPPRILMFFGDEGLPADQCTVIVYWDWFYAPTGSGYRDGASAWVIDHTDETVDLHYNTEPTHWMPLPAPPTTASHSPHPLKAV